MELIKAKVLNTQLVAARAALIATGKNSRQLGDESRLKMLMWIYAWGFTAVFIVKLLLGRTTGGYLQKLARQDWLVATKTKSGVPPFYFTLSEIGLQEVERRSESLCKYIEADPYRVDQPKIRHYLIAQIATIKALNSNSIVSYETERMFGKDGDKLGVKRPDIAWITSNGKRYGVEIELSAKWEKDLDFFVYGIAMALSNKDNESPDYDRFFIISDSPAIIKRYKAAMQPGVNLPMWKKNERGHWAIYKNIKVPEWLISKVDFKLMEI